MQKNLDEYLTRYNTKRPHQGRNIKGRTPGKVLKEGLTKIKNRLNSCLTTTSNWGHWQVNTVTVQLIQAAFT